jgi:N-acetylglucosamine-6-phosphate deacetylase
MKRIKSDKIILEDRIFDGYVYFEDGIITDVTTEERPATEVYDMTGSYVSPGFVDIHTHGGGGYRFEGSTEEIINGCSFHLKHGTTAICPTVSAAPFTSMATSARNIKAAMTDPRVKGTILGVHMEGPYLSAKQAGAQCPIHITAPVEKDYLPFIQENAEIIARWTYAPENDAEEKFAKTLKEYGIMRLASRVHDLKKQGIYLKRTMETAKNRFGEPVHYMRYSL